MTVRSTLGIMAASTGDIASLDTASFVGGTTSGAGAPSLPPAGRSKNRERNLGGTQGLRVKTDKRGLNATSGRVTATSGDGVGSAGSFPERPATCTAAIQYSSFSTNRGNELLLKGVWEKLFFV